ncbi:GIY-YIG nuclease family protein [bacterium AH-315-M05]|nr:GIY-YIG nuclease family protein [bacterium AH-315-M05]
MENSGFFVYILTNKNKTVLYVGITSDFKGRLHQHITGEVKGFTYRYNCHYLVYYERFDYINDAIVREKEIKGWIRKKKEKLIESLNPECLPAEVQRRQGNS